MKLAEGMTLMNFGLLFHLYSISIGNDPANAANVVVAAVFVGAFYTFSPELTSLVEQIDEMVQSRGEPDE